MLKKIILRFKGFFPVKFKTFLKKFRKFNGYNGLDKRMLKYINYNKGFYIECGANDGVSQSNTWYFEKYLGWRGVLIEPVPSVYNELKKNRNSDNFFFNYALRSIKFKKKYIKLKLDLKDSLSTRSTDDNIDNRINIRVKSTNLNNLLNKIKAPNIIDFFSLDVEGDEFYVLRGVNFKRYTFKYLLIESYQLNKLKKFMMKNHYIYLKKMSNRNDHLFKSIRNK